MIADFTFDFFLCNLILCGIISVFLLMKYLFRKILTSRLQYRLWILLFLLLSIPFLPVSLHSFPLRLHLSGAPKEAFSSGVSTGFSESSFIFRDFALSDSLPDTSALGYFLLILWTVGMIICGIRIIGSFIRLQQLKRSALPLQNENVRALYCHCLKELGIKKKIPIYSSAFLSSPMIAGFRKPKIYLPIELLSSKRLTELRYVLLHELYHYKQRDFLMNALGNAADIVYWFNPLVRFSMNRMRTDREIACDSRVLDFLGEAHRTDYGEILLRSVSSENASFPFATGLSGTKKQIKQRILNIASYRKSSAKQKLAGGFAFFLITVFLLCTIPYVTVAAKSSPAISESIETTAVQEIDLSSYFGGYKGSFVLYDSAQEQWKVFRPEQAKKRISPDSTYKIYSALFGLEENVISCENTLLLWDGTNYPFEEWNCDQTLSSAMNCSVNWYFQQIDRQLGASVLNRYYEKIGYGNGRIGGSLSSYWMESSLKISPMEQVKLLRDFHDNTFGFRRETIEAVKDSLCLFSTENGTLYGKTGTGQINGKNVNGWFIGFIENAENTVYFALNLQGNDHAGGSTAAKTAFAILKDLKI